MNKLLLLTSFVALAGCFASALMVFYGVIDEQTYKDVFAVCSIGWFALSAIRIYRPKLQT